MRIAVHAKMMSEERLNGMGYYTYNLLRALAAIDPKNTYDLYSSHEFRHRVAAKNFHEKVLGPPRFWMTYLAFTRELLNDPHDVVFVPHEKLPFFVGGKKVLTAYDLHALKDYFGSPVTLTAKLHFLIAIKSAFKRADKILAISEATKKSVVEIAGVEPDKVIVTPLGYDKLLYKIYGNDEKDAVKKKYSLDRPFVINTSSLLWYRKNIPRIIQAYGRSKFRKDFMLVITGKKGMAYDEVVGEIRRLGLVRDVVLLGYIPIEDMPRLLASASALMFPSLHEGFGLPIVEAFACGCPVITSNVSSMPEVAGDAAMLVDPKDVDGIAHALDKLLDDTTLAEGLRLKGIERAKGFSWEKTAQETLKVFEGLV
ncbi:MAG: glycosyltransferase family 4 protein [Deltaproteobacteria bacterium]|nr:glycosyltransferase family 4 protein [Deltaproteobacteria bacterium]